MQRAARSRAAKESTSVGSPTEIASIGVLCSAMAKATKKPTLCEPCKTARDDPLFKHPRHLVHPATGDHMMFDVHGHAKCPECGAQWRRVLNMVSLIDY
jgi:hypothetical protein